MGASVFNGRYQIGIEVQDKELDYSPSSYSFIMRDSIHDLYPTASINFRDISGQFNEYLTFVEGVKIDISFGLTDSVIKCPYTISRSSTPEQITKTNAGGIMEIPLVHRYFSTQNKISAAYQDEISNIIRLRLQNSKFNFNTINIDPTINKGIWYQPLLNDAEFMIYNLLPFAYSSNAQKSPFFLFIDSNNNFYFKSYKTLYIDENSVNTMKLLPSITLDSMTNDTIFHFTSTQKSLTEFYSTLHRLLFTFDSDSNFSSLQDSISDYPENRTNPIPITWDLSNTTNVIEQLPEDIKMDNTKNNNSGYIISTMKDSFFIDRIIIIVNLNIKLLSGKKITVNVPVGTDATNTDTSQRFSGDYLIETSYQKWTGSLGKTILVCARQEVKVPESYNRQSILVKR